MQLHFRVRRPLAAAPPTVMAVPLRTGRAEPVIGRTLAGARAALAQARTETARKVVAWALVAVAVGALGLAYLVQTSHVASLASERAVLERRTTETRNENARLAAFVAQEQAIGRAESVAQANGLRPAGAKNVVYAALLEKSDPPPAATAPVASRASLAQRLGDALQGRARVDAPVPPLAHPVLGPPLPTNIEKATAQPLPPTPGGTRL